MTECAFPNRTLAPSCAVRYQSYARHGQSLPKPLKEGTWRDKVSKACCFTVVINNQKRFSSLTVNAFLPKLFDLSPHGFDPRLWCSILHLSYG